MVFGWGKKKQEEISQDIVSQTKEIVLSDIPKIIVDLEELRQSQTISEIKDLRNSTESLIDDLINIGNVLEKDDLKVDNIDKHLAIIVVRGKKQVIDIMKKGIVHLPKISSIDDAKTLNSLLNQILKKVGDVLGRQTRVIHIFAKKYATQLKENLEVMTRNHAEINVLLKNYHFTKSISTEISEMLNQIKILQKSRQEKTLKINNLNQNLISVDETLSSLQNSISEIKSSDAFKKYLSLKTSLDSFTSKKSAIKNNVDAQFTKISRPLSRYEYGSSLDKDQKNILTQLANNPIDVLLPQHKDPIIIILENVRKAISSGAISVKDIDKSLSHITETEESLDGFITKVTDYMKQYKTMVDDLDSLKSDELISLEKQLIKTTLLKEEYQTKSKAFQGEIDETDSKIPQLVSVIESKLRQFSNTKYTILT